MIDLSPDNWPTIALWILLIIIALWLLRFIFSIARWLILGVAAAVAGLFLLDKLQGGDALNQLTDKIILWIRGITK